MNKLITALLLTLLLPATSFADEYEQQLILKIGQLLSIHQSNPTASMSYLLGVVDGTLAHARLADSSPGFCAPDSVGLEQYSDLIIPRLLGFAEHEPEWLEHSAAIGTTFILQEIYPCN
jgi:hypothetical protein